MWWCLLGLAVGLIVRCRWLAGPVGLASPGTSTCKNALRPVLQLLSHPIMSERFAHLHEAMRLLSAPVLPQVRLPVR